MPLPAAAGPTYAVTATAPNTRTVLMHTYTKKDRATWPLLIKVSVAQNLKPLIFSTDTLTAKAAVAVIMPAS